MTADPRARRSPESILTDDVRVDTRVQPHDEQRIARIVGGAMAATTGLAALWLVLRSIVSSKIVMVAVATASVTAATAWVIARPSTTVVTKAPRIEAPANVEDAAPTTVMHPTAWVETVASPPVGDTTPAPDTTLVPDTTAPADRTKVRPRDRAVADPPPALLDGDALLEQAALARKDGRIDEAIALYRELGRRLPGTREDGVGCVALARLLQPRDAKQALAVFDRCLADHPRGDLVEPALVGRAEALAKLGRTDDERAAWTELLRRFPSTLHAERAKARLAGETTDG